MIAINLNLKDLEKKLLSTGELQKPKTKVEQLNSLWYFLNSVLSTDFEIKSPTAEKYVF